MLNMLYLTNIVIVMFGLTNTKIPKIPTTNEYTSVATSSPGSAWKGLLIKSGPTYLYWIPVSIIAIILHI